MDELAPRPAHVPPERVLDVDIYDMSSHDADVHLAWKSIQGAHDLIWSPRYGGHWIPTRGVTIADVYRDTKRFSNREISLPAGTSPYVIAPVGSDAPDHAIYRGIVQPSFMPREVEKIGAEARELAIGMIEQFRPRGACEFISEFAQVLPLVIFLRIVDLPIEHREKLHADVEIMTRDPDVAARSGAVMRTAAYLKFWMAERQANPGRDLLSNIACARVQGAPLANDVAIGIGLNMLFGGLDTVTSMMGFIMKFLAENPAHRRWIIDHPDKVLPAAEELMRRHGVGNNLRTAIEDVDLDGVTIHKGDYVYLISCLHGLDERSFANPLAVDFDRTQAINSTFGHGVHRCPGSNLARTEIRITLQEWLARIPEFRIDPDQRVAAQSGPVNGVLRLPLVWDV